jgi:predicted dehydrogenase
VNSSTPAVIPPIRTVLTGFAGGQANLFGQMILDSTKAVLVGAVEAHNPDLARARAAKYGVPGCPVYATIEDALANVEFDLGISASRPEHHEAEMLALLRADKWVHCEKPPTSTLAGMRRVVLAEASSRGWATFNFHLDNQTELIEANVRRGELGVPRMVTTQWLRSLLAENEAIAQQLAGLRRGQPASAPMDDLCHVVRAAIKPFPAGTIIERVVGHSWGKLESLDATVRFPWNGGMEKAQLIATTGWDLPVPGLTTRDLASMSVQGTHGAARLKFLLDNSFPVGAIVPFEHYARLLRLEPDGKITDGLVTSPQPPTPYECMRVKLDDVLDLILRGERPVERADGGLKVMLLLDALRRSERENREVEVEPEDV